MAPSRTFESLFLGGNAANADIDSDVGGVLPLPIGLESEDGHDDKRGKKEIEKVPIHRPIFVVLPLMPGAFIADLPWREIGAVV
jgi:hypothetical protein